MTKLRYLRKKVAKGSDYYYFDAGTGDDGRRILTPLPHIRDPRFGDCYARALAARTNRRNKQGILTLDGLIRSYEKSPKFRAKSENTKRSYSIYLAKANALFRNAVGDSWPVRVIERSDILNLMEKLADTPGAANQTVRALGAMFAWAVYTERLKESPVRDIEMYAATPHEEWPDDLLEEALADPQVGMPVALLYFTGQRINDAIRMSWGDIKNGYMRVYVQKKDKHLRVAIMPELQAMLDRQEKPATTILTNANGTPWTQGGLRQKLQLWAKERGYKVVPHGLRKNAVKSLIEAGCTHSEVMGITDQTIQMVEHYAKGVNQPMMSNSAVVKLDAHRKARNKG